MKTCLITGPTSGIGLETAVKYSLLGYKLILVGRNITDHIIKQIKTRSPKVDYEIIEINLKNLELLKNKINQIKEEVIDIVILNAGIINYTGTTTKHIDDSYIIMVFANYIIIKEIEKKLHIKSYIVFVGSEVARGDIVGYAPFPFPEYVDVNQIIHVMKDNTLSATTHYATAKLLGTILLAGLAKTTVATCLTISPGKTPGTMLFRDAPWVDQLVEGAVCYFKYGTNTVEDSAQRLLFPIEYPYVIVDASFYASPEGNLIGPLLYNNPFIQDIKPQFIVNCIEYILKNLL